MDTLTSKTARLCRQFDLKLEGGHEARSCLHLTEFHAKPLLLAFRSLLSIIHRMASYEDVVAKYGDLESRRPLEGTVVYTSEALDPNASLSYKVDDCIRGVAGVIRDLRGPDVLEQALAPVKASPELFEGITRLAHSELHPDEMASVQPIYAIIRARRLFVARSIYEIITDQPSTHPEPVQNIVRPGVSLSDQSFALKMLALRAGTATTSGPATTKRRRIEHKVKDADYDEAMLARIALAELEPSWALDQLQRKRGQSAQHLLECREEVRRAARILIAARTIARVAVRPA